MGGVYVAEEDGTGRQLAIKTLFKRFAEDEAYVRRFQREAQVYRQMEHPHIVHYIESGFDNGTYFIVLEYVKGKTLGEIMYDQGRLDPVPALKICIALAEALKHAHDKGIVHRDLKPSNVLIDESGEVKLLDFGVAHKDDQLVRTQEGTVVGTYFYAAPEQNQGKKDIDNRTDLYTLGIVFYEMLAGRRPFEGDLLEVAAEQARESYVPLEQLVPDVPTFLPPISRRMMARNPQDRYQSGGELLEELRAALTALTTRRAAPPNLGVRPGAQPVHLELDALSQPGHLGPAPAPAPGLPPRSTPGGITPLPQHGGFASSSPVSLSAPAPIARPVTPAPAPAPTPTASGMGSGDRDTRWHAALEAFQKHHLDQAQGLCEAVIQAAPGFAQGHGLLGKIHAAKGYTYNAIEAFKQALTLAPTDVQIHMDFAMALYTMKLPQKAAEAFEIVLELDPRNMLAVRYLELLKHAGGDVSAPVAGAPPPAFAPAAAPAPYPAPQPGPAGPSLYGDVYQPEQAAPEEAAVGTEAMSRLDAFFSAAPPPVSIPVSPASLSGARPAPSMAPPPVSLAPPPVSAAPPGPGPVQIPPPVHMPGTSPVAPPIPAASEVQPIPASLVPPVSSYAPSASPPAPKRTPEYIPPPKPIDDIEPEPGAAEAPDPDRDGARFSEKKKRSRASDGDTPSMNPDRAWMLGTLWWGLGAAYLGRRGRAFLLTVLEVLVLGLVILPLVSDEFSVWIASRRLNLEAVADWLVAHGLIGYSNPLNGTLLQIQKSIGAPVNAFILENGPVVSVGFGTAVFFLFEYMLPNAYFRHAQLVSLTGRVLEVRRDMSLKISLGEERGVEEGMIFRVEKKKHVDALSQLNFRTMVMAPQVFPIGEAKVISTTPTFAICKFKRYQGQSSSPSANDRVVILRES